jgi:hypothetical protein
METKFKIIETEEYTLAVSDEDASNSYIYFTGDPTGIFRTGIKYKNEAGDYFYQDAITGMSDTYLTTISKKIIAYQPKGNAPELDLPLLPDVEDDAEKLAKKYINDTLRDEESDDYFLGRMEGFKDCYKSVTKVYSEEDLRKAIEESISWWEAKPDEKYGQINTSHDFGDEFIQSLKQPKWFVAKIDIDCTGNNNDGCFMDSSGHNCGCFSLRTTTINNKNYLVGKYLN